MFRAKLTAQSGEVFYLNNRGTWSHWTNEVGAASRLLPSRKAARSALAKVWKGDATDRIEVEPYRR